MRLVCERARVAYVIRNMAEASDSAGPSTMTEHEATAVPSLLSKLRCPQPAAIARKRKVALNPRGKRRSARRGNFDTKSVTASQRVRDFL